MKAEPMGLHFDDLNRGDLILAKTIQEEVFRGVYDGFKKMRVKDEPEQYYMVIRPAADPHSQKAFYLATRLIDGVSLEG